MRRFLQSVYGKLSLQFLVAILALATVVGVICFRSLVRYVDETEQALNRTLAAEMAGEFGPLLEVGIDEGLIEERIRYMTGINRRIEIYLLGSNGMMKASFLGPGQELAHTDIDLEPLRRFIEDPMSVPVYGDDPLMVGGKKPFSAAPVEIMGEKGCFVYVILGGGRYESVADMIRDSYILRTALAGLLIALFLTLAAGLVLFARITRPLREMRDAVSEFQKGEFDKRIVAESDDEFGLLAASFNEMAGTIEQNMEELKRVDRMRRELIANVSHDLRNPLASLQGYLEIIAMKDATLDEEERAKYLETALRSTRTLNTLVDDLFELTKLDARQISPHFERFSLAEMMQDIVMHFESRATAAGVRLEAKINPDLPHVYADIALVERATSNLIDNAIRHTPPGGLVRIVQSAADRAVRVEVADTGVGIPAEDLPYIFDRFFRVEKSRSREDHGGAGLGLAIAKKVLELHGSALSVESAVDEGTTFAFQLPTSRPTV